MTINYEYQINSTNYNPATTTFYWRVISRGAGDGGTAGVVVDDFDTSSGSTLSGGNITTIQVGVKERTGTEGTRNYTLQASTSATFASNVVTKDFQVTDGAAATPAYNSISRSTTSIPEDGATVVTFTVNTSNVTNGTKVGFTFSGTNITGGDFQYSFDNSNWTAGTTSNITNANGVTINSNAGAIYVRALADAAETADETLTITLNATDDASTSTGSLAQSVTITNTSPVAGTLSIAASDTTPQEGDTITFTPSNTPGSASGTYYFGIEYTGGNPAADANFTATPPKSGSRTALAWNGTTFTPSTVQVTLDNLYTIDQGKTFTAGIYTANTGGTAADTVVCTIQEGPIVFSAPAGTTTPAEPTAGIQYVNNNLGQAFAADTETQNVNSLDVVYLDIDGGATFNITPTSNTAGVTVDPNSTRNVGSEQGPAIPNDNLIDFKVDFASASAGAYSVDFNDGTYDHELNGSVTVVGNHTYTLAATNVANGAIYYWRVENTGTVAINAADFITGYSDNGVTTSNSGGYLSGRVVLGTDSGTDQRGTFDIRLNGSRYAGNPDFKVSIYSDSGYTNKVLDGVAGNAWGEITIQSKTQPTYALSNGTGSTSLSEPSAGTTYNNTLDLSSGNTTGIFAVTIFDTISLSITDVDGGTISKGPGADQACFATTPNISNVSTISAFTIPAGVSPTGTGNWSTDYTENPVAITDGVSGTVTIPAGARPTYTVTTTNVPNGTTLFWSAENVSGVVSGTFRSLVGDGNSSQVWTNSSGELNGTVDISSNSGTITLILNRNSGSSGSPQFRIHLYTDEDRTNEVLDGSAYGTITISNTA